MIKNCSACKGRHTAPFGRYCKSVTLEYCTYCVSEHAPPVGTDCRFHRRAELFINQGNTMAREIPISDKFKERSDPEYLQFLEDQLEASWKSRSDTTDIVRRLEALELSQRGRADIPLAGAGTGSPAGRGSADPHTPGLGAVGGLPAATVGGLPAAGRGAGGAPSPPDPTGIDPSLLPLTDALAQLTLAVDPTAGKAKGLFLRPEYYFQHVKSSTPIKQLDHTKLSYKDLVYGWFCVIEHLMSKGGDLGGYVGHCKFVSEQASSESFVDAAFVNYDRHVVTKVVDGLSTTFTAGDMLGVASHFNAANLVINKPAAPKLPAKPARSNKWVRRSLQNADKSSSDPGPVPDGFPEDICYSYNYRSCTGKCSKRHVCRVCKGDHQAKSCTKRE